MPDGSIETGVPPRDFEIGVADAGKQYTNKCFISRLRFLNIADSEASFFDAEGVHVSCQLSVVSGQLSVGSCPWSVVYWQWSVVSAASDAPEERNVYSIELY